MREEYACVSPPPETRPEFFVELRQILLKPRKSLFELRSARGQESGEGIGDGSGLCRGEGRIQPCVGGDVTVFGLSRRTVYMDHVPGRNKTSLQPVGRVE